MVRLGGVHLLLQVQIYSCNSADAMSQLEAPDIHGVTLRSTSGYDELGCDTEKLCF